jgi:Rieske 2Fe-2S family protein
VLSQPVLSHLPWTSPPSHLYLDCVFSQQRTGLRGTLAPLDPDQLATAMAPLGSSRMLPRAAYVGPQVFDWEQANFFSGWQCVGRAEIVAEPGSQTAINTGAAGVLVTRDESGALHAFANVCRHRGHELLPCGATARKKGIVCPYHAWSYRLDGSLLAAPGFRDVAGFEPGGFGLAELPCRDWHGWLFVDGSGQAGDFDEHIGALEDIVAPYAPGQLRITTTHSYEIAANWKVIVENYQECYHCSMIHPELCRVSPPDSGANLDLPGDWVGGWMALRDEAETMSLDGSSRGAVIDGLGATERRTVMYVAVFPNLLLSLHPDYVMTHRLVPLAVDRTYVECAWAFPPAAVERDGFDPSYAVDFWDLTNRQDWAACESVQRGLSSEHARPGPLAPDEDGVQQFVARVAAGYLGKHAAAPTT